MKTARQIKEEKRQSFLAANQINVNLIKKTDVLQNGEIVIAVYCGRKPKVVTTKREYGVKHTFINNEPIRYINLN